VSLDKVEEIIKSYGVALQMCYTRMADEQRPNCSVLEI